MDCYSMTDAGIMAEIGHRLRSLRLRKNMTQVQLAQATTLSLNTIKALELGKGKIASLIAVLRELGGLDTLDSFIPEVTVSPMDLARRGGRKRQRASGRRGKPKEPEGGEPW